MPNTYKDPVCGMELTSDNVAASWNLDEQTYYFCSQECKERFMESPETYLELIEEDEEEDDFR